MSLAGDLASLRKQVDAVVAQDNVAGRAWLALLEILEAHLTPVQDDTPQPVAAQSELVQEGK